MVFKKKRKEYKESDWDLEAWPDPPSGDLEDYGPTEMQEQLFIYHYEPWDRPHFHNLDVVLMVGGAGSGKSICGIAEIIELTTTFPNCLAIVGGVDMPLLKRNVVDQFGKRLSFKDQNGIDQPWEHPVVLRAPAEKTPVAQLINGSSIRFLNIDDPDKVRGFTGDLFMIEEANLMEADSLREMFRRSRGMALPVRQVILNMNPTGRRDWVYDMFCLKQFEPTYEGPPIPIGEPCTCQFCHVCMGQELGQFKWIGSEEKIGPNGRLYEVSGGECPNPECPTLLKNIRLGKGEKTQKKLNSCPGDQHYYRVIKSSTFDNPHIPQDFVQLQRGALSDEEYAMYVRGEIVNARQGYIYKEFGNHNIDNTVEFDPTKDIYWTHDFNFEPMCSVVCQDSVNHVKAVDEFVLWDYDELMVAKAFAKRYEGFQNKVFLYGDPNGLNTSRADSNRSSFKVIYDYLNSMGFDVQMGMRKIKGETLIPIITRVNNLKASLRDHTGATRVLISPKCRNLIESLSHVQWDERINKPKEDENCDETAKTNPKRFKEPCLMTHPQAALGYMITKRFPLIAQKSGVRFLDSAEKTVVAEPQAKELKITKKTTIDYLKEQEDPNRPRSIGSFIPGLNRNSIKERLAYEAAQGEEKQRLQRESLEKFFGGSS